MRFRGRAAHYQSGRPGYPPALYARLGSRLSATLPRDAADIGSGTGIFTEGLLRRQWRVTAVEPNGEMRRVADQRLCGYAGYRSVRATAEVTGLARSSVSLVVAAQAFHWFDTRACGGEWCRLLRPGGVVALVWNERLSDASPFMAAYEEVLRRRGSDYASVAHRHFDTEVVGDFFGAAGVELRSYVHRQRVDRSGLRARALSSSFCPSAGEPGARELIHELETLFDTHESAGRVTFEYATRLFCGRLS